MTSTTTYNPGDILLIPFPFTNLSTHKQRPCLIISSAAFNNSQLDIIAVAITSQIPETISNSEYLLNKREQSACGLPKHSLVKLGKIVTLDKRLIRKKLGEMPKASTKKILTKIKKVISL